MYIQLYYEAKSVHTIITGMIDASEIHTPSRLMEKCGITDSQKKKATAYLLELRRSFKFINERTVQNAGIMTTFMHKIGLNPEKGLDSRMAQIYNVRRVQIFPMLYKTIVKSMNDERYDMTKNVRKHLKCKKRPTNLTDCDNPRFLTVVLVYFLLLVKFC